MTGNRRYPGLPRTVNLPCEETVSIADLSLMLGSPSRQVLHLWRKRHNFPQSYKNGRERVLITSGVEHWLIKQGISVERI